MTVLQRIKELAFEKGISLAEIERSAGLSSGSITKWDKSSPSTDKLLKVATYLHVSMDYLTGNSENVPTETTPEWASEEDILELDKMLDSNVNMSYGGENLTEDEKQRVKDILTGVFWEKLEKKKKLEN
ncbi:hypothetical protein A5888_001934 [Enterococcus sp. 9E7_DIV0242]|uniref:HTH cro/C1-type domain-containing protein n=2 Tax=Candidatus Enterococcus clewellii TaxID=1834193 RepID=A0A242K456_9ENTE|nr:helix-turn-helix transcriptional regulator [Enterococcus sp. 9E7_DIV0242]OTP13402.1 hypothetical protein A5888_002880 [Enterococcus sp. 9E7_DIV0242]